MYHYNSEFPVISAFFWISVVALTLVCFFELSFFDFFGAKSDNNIIDFNAAVIIALTTLIACIAWIQLSGLQKVGKSDFLFRIDEHFTNPQIIRAREIIQQLYIRNKNKLLNGKVECLHSPPKVRRLCDKCKSQLIKLMREEIRDIGRSEERTEEFIHLRTLLDYHETIGYFAFNRNVEPSDVNELMGGTIEFHYLIFRDWISYLQEEEDIRCYDKFEWLIYSQNKDLVPKSRWKNYTV